MQTLGSHPLILYWVAWYDHPYPTPNCDAYPQYHPVTGVEQRFEHLDQARVRSVVFMPFSPELADKINTREGRPLVAAVPLPRYVVHLTDGQRLICLRRTTLAAKMRAATGQLHSAYVHDRVYLLGWQETRLEQVNGQPEERNHKSVMFIHADGTVELSSDGELR